MPTADESNHSAPGMLHPQRSVTCFLYVTLRLLIPQMPFPFGGGLATPLQKIILRLTRPINPDDIIGVHTLNFYCY